MKVSFTLKVLLPAIAGFLFSAASAQPVIVVSSSGSTTYAFYNNLKHAFDSINAGYQTGNIEIQINGNCTETATASLDSSGRLNPGGVPSSYTGITIRPVGGVWTISGAIAAGNPLINFNGADNVTIDGVNNTTDSLIISNTTVSATSGTCTIRFINDASSNTVTNTVIKGAPTMSTTTNGGVVFFSTAVQTGNENNTISNCLIGNSDPLPANFPYKLIFMNGTTTTTQRANKNIMITGNRLVNFRTNALYVNTGNYNVTVSGNHFYHTSTIPSNSTLIYAPVYISNASGTGFNVNGNYIGGSEPYCGGSKDTVVLTGTLTTGMFHCIYLNVATSGLSYINGNTITNSVLQSASTTAAPVNCFILINAGRVHCGSESPNLMGSMSDTGALVTYFNGTGLGFVSGIYTGTSTLDTVRIENNLMGGITHQSISAGQASLRLIFTGPTSTTGKFFIRNNILGSPVVLNSIKSVNNNNTKVFVFRHENTGTAFTHEFVGNICSNISNYSNVSSNGNLVGFAHATANASYIIDSNTFQHFNNYAPTNLNDPAGISAIYIKTPAATPTFTIRGNTIRNFTMIDPAAKAKVVGMDFFSPATAATLISGNHIYALNATSLADTAGITGIRVNTTAASGIFTFTNNEISLGRDSAGNDIVTGHAVYGIQHISGHAKYLHNSVLVSGQYADPRVSTYAFYGQEGITATLDIRNNVFSNQRSFSYYPAFARNVAANIGGTVSNGSITGLTCNYNLYHVSGTAGIPVVNAGLEYQLLSNWQLFATAHDVNSMEGDPMFYAPTLLYGTTGSSLFAGDPSAGVITDIAGNLRTNYLVGAYDLLNALPVSLLYLQGVNIQNNVALKWKTASETANRGFEVQRSADRKSFETIGFVKGRGTTTLPSLYDFNDNEAFVKTKAAVLYYRLKQVDDNGAYVFSGTVAVSEKGTATEGLAFYPNPVVNKAYLQVDPEAGKTVEVHITDIMGNEVYHGVYETGMAGAAISMDLSALGKGFYFATVSSNGKHKTIKICKSGVE